MTTESSWDAYLVAEHELIERAMAVLQGEIEKLAAEGFDAFKATRAVDFLLEFGDKIHNIKEELHLFPLLEAHGIPRQGPIGVMLQEHEAERQLLAEMQPQLKGLGDSDDATRQSFVQKTLDYLQIRANHIWKENDVLYAMGRRVLNETHNEALLKAFGEIDRTHYGEDARARFVAMVDEMERGAGSGKKMIENLSYAQLDAIMEALPVEVTFVDAKDEVAYFNRLDREKIFVRTRSVIGRKVEKCHPQKSVHIVREIVASFKDGRRDKAEFWIDFAGDKVLIQYFAVRDDEGRYQGVLEVTQKIGALQKMTGQKVLLDEQ